MAFTLYNVNANGSRDYLAAGDSMLPVIHFCYAFVFCAMGLFWVYLCTKNKEYVHHIHVLMLILVGLKVASEFFHGVAFHFIQIYGKPVGWNVVYYCFTFLKGIMLFSVIMLVGTGWSLLKVRLYCDCVCFPVVVRCPVKL